MYTTNAKDDIQNLSKIMRETRGAFPAIEPESTPEEPTE